MARVGKITKSEVREKFIGEHYPIHIVGRNVEITEPMKSYALGKMTHEIENFGGRVIDAMIVMDIQRGMHMVDFLVDLNDKKIIASGKTHDMYASIDMAIEHLKTKLSRYHDMLHSINRTKIGYAIHPGETGISPLDDINDQIEEENLKAIEKELKPSPISHRETTPLKRLNEQEAILKMEVNHELHCLLFLHEENEKVHAIYRLPNGTYGIIQS